MGYNRSVIKLMDVLEPTKDLSNFQTIYYVFDAQKTDLLWAMMSGVKMNEVQIKTILYSLLCGLHFIHTAGVIHRDL